ncbi:hypothetical protein Acr_00g0076870 [Actinidia rufa]|uniref:Uncharacterized protein n=1 Tax=Actinidia rufa TaxID=165716 RepID=A0A7J0DT89_9ERIC|nr:hypothetical protein Acr_00g0076870 [Actinidia rufa]
MRLNPSDVEQGRLFVPVEITLDYFPPLLLKRNPTYEEKIKVSDIQNRHWFMTVTYDSDEVSFLINSAWQRFSGINNVVPNKNKQPGRGRSKPLRRGDQAKAMIADGVMGRVHGSRRDPQTDKYGKISRRCRRHNWEDCHLERFWWRLIKPSILPRPRARRRPLHLRSTDEYPDSGSGELNGDSLARFHGLVLPRSRGFGDKQPSERSWATSSAMVLGRRTCLGNQETEGVPEFKQENFLFQREVTYFDARNHFPAVGIPAETHKYKVEVGDFIRFYKTVSPVNWWHFLIQHVRGDKSVGTSDLTQPGGPSARNDGNEDDKEKSDRGGRKSRSRGHKVKKFAPGHCYMALKWRGLDQEKPYTVL